MQFNDNSREPGESSSTVFLSLSTAFLTEYPWRLFTPDGRVAADRLDFKSDGTVSGHNWHQAARWLIEGGTVCFASSDGAIHTRFELISQKCIRLMLHGNVGGDPNQRIGLERRGWSFRPPARLELLKVATSRDAKTIQALGLCYGPVTALFGGSDGKRPSPAETPCLVMNGTHPGIVEYIVSSHRLACFTFNLIDNDGFAEDVFSGEMVRCVRQLTRADRGEMPYNHLAYFYQFVSADGRDWWVVTNSVGGQTTLLYLPGLGVAIVARADTTPPDLARILVRELEIAAEESPPLELQGLGYEATIKVGVIDMIANHGHQLINLLPGAERLLQSGCAAKLDEIWIAGPEFFGPIEAIFPELAGRVRRYASCWDVAAASFERPVSIYGIGSTCAQGLLIERIRDAALRSFPQSSTYPRTDLTVAFTLRGRGRNCVNLIEVILACVNALQNFGQITVVLDGWVLPESIVIADSAPLTLWQNGFHREFVELELQLVSEVIRSLPPGVIVRSLVGHTMLNSISGLQGVDAYVAHVGTLQHKLSFLTGAPGVIHGPREQLSVVEAGPYCCALGHAPVVLDRNFSEDAPSTNERGSRFNDYLITQPEHVASELVKLVSRRYEIDNASRNSGPNQET